MLVWASGARQELAERMIEHDVGVSSARTYEVKRIDTDYFLEE